MTTIADCCPTKSCNGVFSGLSDHTVSGSSQNDPANVDCGSSKRDCDSFISSHSDRTQFLVVGRGGRYHLAAHSNVFGGTGAHEGTIHPIVYVTGGVDSKVVFDLSTFTENAITAIVGVTGTSLEPAALLNTSADARLAANSHVGTPLMGVQFTMQNRSECASYIYTGDNARVEGVAKSVGVRPRETVSMFLDPVARCWRMVGAGPRA